MRSTLADLGKKASLARDGRRCEPERLRQGKSFHRHVQAEWEAGEGEGEGEVVSEKPVVKPSGRRGRVDIFVAVDGRLVAIAEIKYSDWDAMTQSAARRNVKRQARQIWDYIDSQLALGRDVSPGVVFPKRPESASRLALVETLFDAEGIPVVWYEESTEERRSRT